MTTEAQIATVEPPDSLRAPAQRLYRITGFVTALCSEADTRPLAYCRYYHVRRVAWLADRIATQRVAAGHEVDQPRVRWLAWAHDLNRWPFAHNSERGLFDQGADLHRYFATLGDDRADPLVDELRAVVDRDVERLSEAGRITLLADILTGFIEDPLWAITGLDLVPQIVPSEIASYLGLPLADPSFLERLRTLNATFFDTRAVQPFKVEFDAIFGEVAEEFVGRHGVSERLPLGDPGFEARRRAIKEDFMLGRLFPYNNEKVSHGSLIRRTLIEPLLQQLGDSGPSILTTIDEEQLLTMATERGLIEPGDREKYLPSLDYVAIEEPEMSFSGRGHE